MKPSVLIFLVLALVMAVTRVNHFGPLLPDASWAVFFIAGFHLRAQMRWAFPALMVLAVLVDWFVISRTGQPFWTHYCVSPGYWFLLPAYFSLFAAGAVLRPYCEPLTARSVAFAALALVAGVALCHLFAQGGFYWFSSSVAAPTFAGWVKNYGDWFLPYLTTAAIYTAIAAAIHVVQVKFLRTSTAKPAAR